MQAKSQVLVLPDDPGIRDIAYELSGLDIESGPAKVLEVPRDHVLRTMASMKRSFDKVQGITWGAHIEEERLKSGMKGFQEMGKHFSLIEGWVFGRPVLCLFSRTGLTWNKLPNKLKIVYEKRFERLSREYISGLVSGGYQVESECVDGCLGSWIKGSDYDLAIGTLCCDTKLEETGMYPLDRIWDGGAVLLQTEEY